MFRYWHEIFALLRGHKEFSNDPRTQIACMVLDADGAGLATACNWIPHTDPASLTRDEKLAISQHAEERALLGVAVEKRPLIHTLVNTGTPCLRCVEKAIEYGVARIVVDHDEDPFRERLKQEPTLFKFAEAKALMEQNGIYLLRMSLVNQGAERDRVVVS